MKTYMCLHLANQACFNAPVIVFHTKRSGPLVLLLIALIDLSGH